MSQTESTYVLEPATTADGPVLARLFVDYFREIGLEIDPQGLDKDMAAPLDAYDQGGLILVRCQERAVGCCGLLRVDELSVELKRMYLEPDHRGGGLGQRLLRHMIDLARARGYRRMVLDTRRQLTAANRMYEKNGFVDIPAYNDNFRANRYLALDL